jgi:glycosyltransferase involved in cell wall biosynthesis
VEKAIRLERENYAASERVVAMGRWAADAVIHECEIPASKVNVILPGANLHIPKEWKAPELSGEAGIDRPFTLGFIGKDWHRKGLMLLSNVQKELVRRGWKCRVLAAGNAPEELQSRDGIEFVGYIDKASNADGFLQFLSKCDVGCLFSSREALGISTLEFLLAGVPVAGFAHEGPADTLPPDAGFRFALATDFSAIADRLETYLQAESEQKLFRQNAREWSRRVTWERCLREFQELWDTGTIANPVQPWKGLAGDVTATSA